MENITLTLPLSCSVSLVSGFDACQQNTQLLLKSHLHTSRMEEPAGRFWLRCVPSLLLDGICGLLPWAKRAGCWQVPSRHCCWAGQLFVKPSARSSGRLTTLQHSVCPEVAQSWEPRWGSSFHTALFSNRLCLWLRLFYKRHLNLKK